MPLLVDDHVARSLLAAAAILVVAGELLATYLGQSRDGRRVFGRSGDGAVRQDRGTKLAVAVGAYLGIGAAIVIAKSPASASAPTPGGRSGSVSRSYSPGPHFATGRS